MIVFIRLRAWEFGDVEDARELVEVEHGVVFAVLAVVGGVFAEPHIFEVKGDEAAVTPLDALAELEACFFCAHIDLRD
jgi:hypothetical protein